MPASERFRQVVTEEAEQLANRIKSINNNKHRAPPEDHHALKKYCDLQREHAKALLNLVEEMK